MKQKIKQTAVEWLVNMWEMQGTITPLDIREAKRIEQEQMVDWYATGQADTVNMYEQHLNKTFNTNEK
jgi:hypothetical protein